MQADFTAKFNRHENGGNHNRPQDAREDDGGVSRRLNTDYGVPGDLAGRRG